MVGNGNGFGWVLIFIGAISLIFPQLAFHIYHLDLKDAEISDAGKTMWRVLGAVSIVLGVVLI